MKKLKEIFEERVTPIELHEYFFVVKYAVEDWLKQKLTDPDNIAFGVIHQRKNEFIQELLKDIETVEGKQS